jgi:hypothetical protein
VAASASYPAGSKLKVSVEQQGMPSSCVNRSLIASTSMDELMERHGFVVFHLSVTPDKKG